MAVPTTPKTSASHHRWWLEITFATMALAALLIVLITPPRPKSVTNTTTLPTPGVTSTPLTFSDFSGQVQSINGSVASVLFRGLDASGQIMERTYAVNVDQGTVVQSLTTVNGKATSRPIVLADVKPNDTVFVAGNGNLATLTSFTATKLIVSNN